MACTVPATTTTTTTTLELVVVVVVVGHFISAYMSALTQDELAMNTMCIYPNPNPNPS